MTLTFCETYALYGADTIAIADALDIKENTPPKVVKKRKTVSMSACVACGKACPIKQKFCSINCSSKTRFPPLNRTCGHCSASFRTSPSSDQKFCSYTCFVEDGGAVRAGNAAAEAIMKKYGAKKDANHNEIMDVIRQITAVHDLSHAGYGVPDGIAWVGGAWQLFDIKNLKTSYGKKGLNQRQKQWAKDWRGGPVYLVHDEHEAQCFARGKFESLKCEGGFKVVSNG